MFYLFAIMVADKCRHIKKIHGYSRRLYTINIIFTMLELKQKVVGKDIGH